MILHPASFRICTEPCGDLENVESCLRLNAEQLEAWRIFGDVYRETKSGIEAADAFASREERGERIGIAGHLDALGHTYSARLMGARRLARAVQKLHAQLDDRQRSQSERRLWGACNKLFAQPPLP